MIITRQWRCVLVVLAFSAAAMMAAISNARAQSAQAVSFRDFMTKLETARAEDYIGQPNVTLKNSSTFYEMRSYLLSMYRNAQVKRSFALDDQTFDCVPTMQQPSVRLMGIKKIASPPPTSPSGSGASAAPELPAATDAFGNTQQCDSGTIPMRRITLEELTQYPSLREFFKKSPDSIMQTINGIQRSVPVTHRWSHAYQFVNNYGGLALHNVWLPPVATNKTEVFSLSQQWYTAGSGGSTQTAEIGWQNYPQKWGGQKAVAFVYWTADNYTSTGCYNLDCPGFVQTSSKHPLGARLHPVSTKGGQQYEEFFGYRFFGGNWWAAVGPNVKKSYWVGYYPGSLYGAGPMASYATKFDIGGETAGGNHWAPMGSGKWAVKGYQNAAYDRGIQYRDSNNNGYSPSLTPVTQPSKAYKCYSYTTPAYDGSTSWLTYFYFGGPGGKSC